VAAGIASFRKTPESKWQPKTPGELLPFIKTEVSKAARSLAACARVVAANAQGHNVDTLREKVETAIKESPKAGAYAATWEEVQAMIARG
jgi:hypothetical protein